VLADVPQYLPAALKYIRRFGPDLSFAPDEAGSRWAYITVVATPQQITDKQLEAMRGEGAILVERVIDSNPQATQTLLDSMAGRGQRFLTNIQPVPPQTEPPTDSPEPPAETRPATYLVQPGDTLSQIALKFYGEARLWPLIFEANRDKLASPSMLRVGMELHLPEQP
jgi:hypothetical protein